MATDRRRFIEFCGRGYLAALPRSQPFAPHVLIDLGCGCVLGGDRLFRSDPSVPYGTRWRFRLLGWKTVSAAAVPKIQLTYDPPISDGIAVQIVYVVEAPNRTRCTSLVADPEGSAPIAWIPTADGNDGFPLRHRLYDFRLVTEDGYPFSIRARLDGWPADVVINYNAQGQPAAMRVIIRL